MGIGGVGVMDSLARVASINHDPYYHGLHNFSNTIIVLVFSEMASFVRMILQIEENKGVEFTVYPRNGLRAPGGGGQVTVALIKSKSALLMDWSGQVRNDCWSGTNSKPAPRKPQGCGTQSLFNGLRALHSPHLSYKPPWGLQQARGQPLESSTFFSDA